MSVASFEVVQESVGTLVTGLRGGEGAAAGAGGGGGGEKRQKGGPRG
jgi:hypothetical protein